MKKEAKYKPVKGSFVKAGAGESESSRKSPCGLTARKEPGAEFFALNERSDCPGPCRARKVTPVVWSYLAGAQKREREGDRQTRIRSVRYLQPFRKKAAFEVFINITREACGTPTQNEHVGNVRKRLSTCLFRQWPAGEGQGKSGGERTGIFGASLRRRPH